MTTFKEMSDALEAVSFHDIKYYPHQEPPLLRAVTHIGINFTGVPIPRGCLVKVQESNDYHNLYEVFFTFTKEALDSSPWGGEVYYVQEDEEPGEFCVQCAPIYILDSECLFVHVGTSVVKLNLEGKSEYGRVFHPTKALAQVELRQRILDSYTATRPRDDHYHTMPVNEARSEHVNPGVVVSKERLQELEDAAKAVLSLVEAMRKS